MPATVLTLVLLATLMAWSADATIQYTPLGCFEDGTSRAMTGPILTQSDMTISLCAQTAASQGYTIFGLQVGQRATMCIFTRAERSVSLPSGQAAEGYMFVCVYSPQFRFIFRISI